MAERFKARLSVITAQSACAEPPEGHVRCSEMNHDVVHASAAEPDFGCEFPDALPVG